VRTAISAAALASSILFWGVANAQIYKYVDERGRVHLTNIPRSAPERTAQRYGELVRQAAHQYHVSASLLHAVILTESGYRPDAVSSKGAVGLMQLLPGTAERYRVINPRDPAQNISGGAQYLRDLLLRFDHDLPLTLAAYNAGEAAVLRYGAIPPYAETTRYVRTVLRHYAPEVEYGVPRRGNR
jgi:soluble lytic murein transglycosylase-like protein